MHCKSIQNKPKHSRICQNLQKLTIILNFEVLFICLDVVYKMAPKIAYYRQQQQGKRVAITKEIPKKQGIHVND